MGADQPVADEEVRRLLKQAATELGARAWIVGGYVRDRLLGRPHPDIDVVVEEGLGFEVARRFAQLAGAPEPVIFERFGRFWGWFSVGDLFFLNALTIVTEFIGVSLALSFFGLPRYVSVPVAAVLSLKKCLSFGRARRGFSR